MGRQLCTYRWNGIENCSSSSSDAEKIKTPDSQDCSLLHADLHNNCSLLHADLLNNCSLQALDMFERESARASADTLLLPRHVLLAGQIKRTISELERIFVNLSIHKHHTYTCVL